MSAATVEAWPFICSADFLRSPSLSSRAACSRSSISAAARICFWSSLSSCWALVSAAVKLSSRSAAFRFAFMTSFCELTSLRTASPTLFLSDSVRRLSFRFKARVRTLYANISTVARTPAFMHRCARNALRASVWSWAARATMAPMSTSWMEPRAEALNTVPSRPRTEPRCVLPRTEAAYSTPSALSCAAPPCVPGWDIISSSNFVEDCSGLTGAWKPRGDEGPWKPRGDEGP
mmetsp:Transcript_81368/g.143485  ORF Transcript_81368/g.143485 Transcript_81368/m.143485 type:complete len:233 (-) Transcript_81368:195-893(-)